MQNSPQKELNLTWPFPHVNGPKGFKGFAVNMINLSDENLNITTKGGHGLRETLFYSLFGELQVYETRDDMFRAKDYLNGGAISLDGGIIKGKGKLLLGYRSVLCFTSSFYTMTVDLLDGFGRTRMTLNEVLPTNWPMTTAFGFIFNFRFIFYLSESLTRKF